MALGYRSVWCLALDVLERNGAGRLEVAASLDLETRLATGHGVVSGIALHGERNVLHRRGSPAQRDSDDPDVCGRVRGERPIDSSAGCRWDRLGDRRRDLVPNHVIVRAE